MPKNHSIEIIDGISVVRFEKKASWLDILSAVDDVLAIGEFKLRLWIFNSGIDASTCIDDVKKVAAYGKKVWPLPSKVAFVAPDDFAFGISRMHEVFREQEGLKSYVFRTTREAIIWLKDNDT